MILQKTETNTQEEKIAQPSPKKRINWKGFLSFKLIDIFAIVAVVFAYKQFHDAKVTLDTLPTRYLDDFPQNMNGVIDQVIIPAKENLTIITDYPLYGIYSNSQKAVEYRTKILDKANNIKVKLVFYDYNTRKQQFANQFNLNKDSLDSPTYFEKEFMSHSCGKNDAMAIDGNNINFSCRGDKMKNFIATFKPLSVPKTCNQFFETMNGYHIEFVKLLKAGKNVTIDSINFQLSSAFWLADNSVLAFSMNSLGKKAQESTFVTRDPSIIGFANKTYENLIKE